MAPVHERSNGRQKTAKRTHRGTPDSPIGHAADDSGCAPDSLHAVLITIRNFALAGPGISDNPGDYVSDLRVQLECRPEDGPDRMVGMIRGHIVDMERAVRARRFPLFDLYDEHSQELSDVWFALHQSSGELKPAVRKLLGGTPHNRNVLVLGISEIEPAHRGRSLGLYAAGQVIEALKSTCTIAVGQPYPMQFGPCGEDPEWMQDFGAGLGGDLESGLRKLRGYWGRLGFRSIPGSTFCVLNTHNLRLVAR